MQFSRWPKSTKNQKHWRRQPKYWGTKGGSNWQNHRHFSIIGGTCLARAAPQVYA